jgi:hypothetical protein
LIYYFSDEQMALPQNEPTEWFDIKWMDGWFKCIPVDPPKDAPKADAPDWDKINLGKCRHGILCAAIQGGYEISAIGSYELEQINKLAQFSLNGKIVVDGDD